MDQSEWMIYLYKDVLTGKRNKLIYSLLNYDFVQYTTVYEYMRLLDFHREWSYRDHSSIESIYFSIQILYFSLSMIVTIIHVV